MKTWEPDEALAELTESQKQLVADTDLSDSGQARQLVAQIFRDSLVAVAQGVVHTSLYEPNARIRFEAQKYVIDVATAVGEGESDPLARIVAELTEVTRAAASDR